MMQPEGFVDPKGVNKIASSSDPSMDWCKHLRVWNICFDELIKAYNFIHTCGEAYIYKKVSGSSTTFLVNIYE